MKELKLKYLLSSFFAIMLTFSGNAQLVADFTQDTTAGCSPLLVNFTDASSGPGITYREWVFGNGNFSVGNNQNVSAIYSDPGDYDVTLIISDGVDTATITKTALITVFESPIAAFTVDQTGGCVDLPIQFTDAVTLGDAAITSYTWDFGDGNGTTTSGSTIGHLYTVPGTYSISLTVVDGNQCSHTMDSVDVITASGPNIAFTATPLVLCDPPGNIAFTDLTTGNGPFTYEWDFGDGGSSTDANATHTYTTFGLFDISVIVTDAFGCEDTAAYQNYILVGNLQPEWQTQDSIYCPGESIDFFNTSNGAYNVEWDFGDGTGSLDQDPPDHSYNTPGTYPVTLQASTSNCSATFVDSIYIEEVIAAVTFLDSNQCFPDPLIVQDGSTGNFNSLIGEFTFSSDSLNGQVLGIFNLNPNDSTFMYSTIGGFHDGAYVVTTDQGCTDSIYLDNQMVINQIDADFNASIQEGCAPMDVMFSDTSSPPDSIATWVWDFGNGDSAFVANPSYTFGVGTHQVILTVTTAGGCTATTSKIVRAGVLPTQIGFTLSDTVLCVKDALMCEDTTISDTLVDWVVWDFESSQGAASGVGPVVSIGFQGPGIYDLTIQSGMNGCVKDSTLPNAVEVISVDPFIKFQFDCDSSDRIRVFNPNLDANIHNWYWDFGDGSPLDSISTDVVHVFSPGDYWIKLHFFDPTTGCDNVDSLQFNNTPGDAVIEVLDSVVCLGDSIQVDLSYSSLSFLYGDLSWDTLNIETIYPGGNEMIDSVQEFMWYYDEPGDYEIYFITKRMFLCGDTVSHSVTVNAPVVEFMVDTFSTCDPFNAHFTDLSVSNLPIVSWDWDFGNGLTSTDQNPQNILYNNGLYTVSLVAEDSQGCRDSVAKFNYILARKPPAFFTTDDRQICVGDSAMFTSMPIGAFEFSWDYGDGTFGGTDDVYHTYTAPGVYTITLTVADTNGCDSTFTQPLLVEVFAFPEAGLLALDTVFPCYPIQANFQDTVNAPGITSWTWNFGDGGGNTITTNPTAVNTYTAPGTYDVSLIVTNAVGCGDTALIQALVTVEGPVVTFTLQNDTVCIDDPVIFTMDVGNDVNDYTWDFGDGTVNVYPSSQTLVSYQYSQTGFVHPQLLFTDTSGVCSVVIDTSVFIDAITTDFNITTDTALCVNEIFQFTDASSANIDIWEWDFGDATTGVGQNVSHAYASPGTYTVTLTTTDLGAGCQGVISKDVLVQNFPTGDAGWNAVMCFGDTAQLGAFGGLTYQWQSSPYLLNPSSSDVLVFPPDSTWFYCTITDVNGCSIVDSAMAIVIPPPPVDAGQDFNLCSNDSTQLTVTGANSYIWLQGTNLSNTNVPNPWVTPGGVQTYIVEGEDNFGCKNTDTVTVTEIQAPNVDAGTGGNICSGQSFQLQGVADSSLIWSPSASLSSDTILDPIASPTTTQTYTLITMSSNGCFSLDDVTVIVNPGPPLTLNTTQQICRNDTVNMTVTGAQDYVWLDSLFVSGVNDSVLNIFPDSTMFFNVIGADAQGCQSEDSILVVVTDNPVIDAGIDLTICEFDTAFIPVSGAPTFTWDPNGDINQISQFVYSATPSVTTTYVVTGEDANGCTENDTIVVVVNSEPNIDAGPNQEICIGQNAVLNGSGGVQYIWNNGQDLINEVGVSVVTAPSNSLYCFVEGTDANNCVGFDSVFVTVHPLPEITIPPVEVCIGDTTQLQPSNVNGGVFTWTPNFNISDTSIQSPFVWPDSTIDYFVSFIDINGCSNEDTARVQVHEPIVILDMSGDTMVFGGFDVDLFIDGLPSYQYSWTPSTYLNCTNCSEVVSTPFEEIEYFITISDTAGCYSLDTTILIKIDPNSNVYVPNAFTPDGDGINDVFCVEQAGMKELQFLEIYNRWGRLIYLSRSFSDCWDGVIDGVEARQDVYVYRFQAIDAYGNKVEKTGHVTLMR